MSGSGFAQFIPLILIFVIFYFFLIRPQQKKVKEHKLMVAALKRGDEVITSGGIVGKVEKDDFSGGVRLVSDKVMTLMSVREQHVKRLLLKLPEERRSSDVVSQLSLVIKPFCGGSCPVVIGYQGDSSSVDIRLGQQWRVRPEMALVKQLQQALGSDAVILEY